MRKTMRLFSVALCAGVLVMSAYTVVVSALIQDGNQEKQSLILRQAPLILGDPAQPLLLPLPGGGLSWRGGQGVKDSPFSGEIVLENIQTLKDGNRIVQRTTTTIYRDSQGRTRQDAVHKLPGISNEPNREHKTIQIFDPVAGHTYTIDPQGRTVHKFVDFARPLVGPNSVGAAAGIAFRVAVPNEGNTAVADGTGVSSATNGRVPPGLAISSVTYGGPHRRMPLGIGAKGESKSESLGLQLIEGIAAEGTRITHTIPAGAIGNENPIDITTERWFSQELKMDVLLKTDDPRTGEIIQRLTNITQGEPDPSLFEVPPDYTVREMQPPVLGRDETGKIKLLRERGKPNDQ
jgi:hypothetical protein